jgi:hypothetical protein
MIVTSFDVYHRLTRGTSSRTWDNDTADRPSTSINYSFQTMIRVGRPRVRLGNLRDTGNVSPENECKSSRIRIFNFRYHSEIDLDLIDDTNNQDDSNGQYWIDSFFDVYYEIPTDRENDSRVILGVNLDFHWGYGSDSKEPHPDFVWRASTVVGWSEDDDDLGGDENETSNRIIISAWREFNGTRRYKIGINSNTDNDKNGSTNHIIISKWSDIGPSTSFRINLSHSTEENDDGNSVTTNFKLEIEGVAAGHFTGVDNLSIEEEVIDYNDHETFWCRIETIMSGPGSGNGSLPEVDDEVDVLYSRKQEFDLGDEDGLHDYQFNISIEDLIAGEKPKRSINVQYNYTGDESYWGNISYDIRTINNETVNGTYIYIKLDTYKKTVDEAGNIKNVLEFTDVIKLRYDMINIDSRSGSFPLKEVLEVVIDHAEYG